MTVREIASFLDGDIVGNASLEIVGIAKIEVTFSSPLSAKKFIIDFPLVARRPSGISYIFKSTKTSLPSAISSRTISGPAAAYNSRPTL